MLGLNMRNPHGQSYLEVMHMQAAGGTAFVPTLDTAVPDGPYQIQVKPWLSEYYEENQRVAQILDVDMIQYPFDQTPEREPEERTRLLLEHAVRQPGNLYGELAKIKLARGSVEEAMIQQGIEAMTQGHADARTGALGSAADGTRGPAKPGPIEGSVPTMDEYSPPLPAISRHLSHPREAVESFLESVCRWLAGGGGLPGKPPAFQDRSGSELQEEARQEIHDWILARMQPVSATVMRKQEPGVG